MNESQNWELEENPGTGLYMIKAPLKEIEDRQGFQGTYQIVAENMTKDDAAVFFAAYDLLYAAIDAAPHGYCSHGPMIAIPADKYFALRNAAAQGSEHLMKDLIEQAQENIKRSVEGPLERIAALELTVLIASKIIEKSHHVEYLPDCWAIRVQKFGWLNKITVQLILREDENSWPVKRSQDTTLQALAAVMEVFREDARSRSVKEKELGG